MNSLDEKTVGKYLSGECSEAEIEQILQWLLASEDNRKEWLKLRVVSARSNYAHFSDPQHIARSLQELQKEKFARAQFEKKITRKIALRFIRYAACILLLIGLSYASYLYVTHRLHPEMLVVTTSGNEPTKQIMLEDSSRVWLSAGSRIEYPQKFEKKERVVFVDGKVFFDVTKDVTRPFIVNTESYTVKVLGTSFEVNTPKYSPISDVTLVKGAVEILDNQKNYLCTLQPGQQFEIDKISNRFVLHQVNAEMYTSWYSGNLEFDGLTFAEIAKALERHYGVTIILAEDIAKEKKLVGSLSFKKDIFQMMKAIELVVPIKYHVKTSTIVYIQSK